MFQLGSKNAHMDVHGCKKDGYGCKGGSGREIQGYRLTEGCGGASVDIDFRPLGAPSSVQAGIFFVVWVDFGSGMGYWCTAQFSSNNILRSSRG